MNVYKILLSFGFFCGMQAGLFVAEQKVTG